MLSTASEQWIEDQYMGGVSIPYGGVGGYRSTHVYANPTQRGSNTNFGLDAGQGGYLAPALFTRPGMDNRTQYENAKTFSIKSGTLIRDWAPPPISQNQPLNPENRFGEFLPDKSDINYNRGNWAPNGQTYQQYRPFPTPLANANRYEGIDNRQIANYQIHGLVENPLSASYRKNSADNNPIPQFFCDTKPKDYSGMTASGVTGHCYGDYINAQNISSGTFPDTYIQRQPLDVQGKQSLGGMITGPLPPVPGGGACSTMRRGVGLNVYP